MKIDTKYMGYTEGIAFANCLRLIAETGLECTHAVGGVNPNSGYTWIWSEDWPCAIAAMGEQEPFFSADCYECGHEEHFECLEEARLWACPECGTENS